VSDIAQIAKGLCLGTDGIWHSSQTLYLSYPDEAHDLCYELEDRSFWFHHRSKCILSVLKSYPSSGTIFDIGGGNGFNTREFLKNGIDAVLVEPGASGVKNAYDRGLKNIIHATVEQCEFLPDTLPAVSLFDVLEHIENDEAFLKTVINLLSPGGRLYLTVPAWKILWSDEDVYAGHFRRYTSRSLKELLLKCGYSVEFRSYFFWILPLPIFLFRVLPTLIGLRKQQKGSKMREEVGSNGLMSRIVSFLIRKELWFISKRISVPFGSSCFIVAKRTK
jgi:SAM-dependent methyltransferase